MHIVDVHCHLDLYGGEHDPEAFNLDAFIQQQQKAGVKAIITNGTLPESNRKALEYAKKYDMVKAALGFYPTHVLEYSEDVFEEELRFMEQHKEDIVALGEVGLDHYHIKDKLGPMKEALTKIVGLAKNLDKPVIVHSRSAETATVELLEQIGWKKIVMHCFSGKKKLVRRILDNGWAVSIPCSVVKLQQFQDMVREAPLQQLLTETDGPFLSPFPGIKRNEPRYIAESLKTMAALKQLDEEEMSNVVFMNYQRWFC